jgi:hypothetical protein
MVALVLAALPAAPAGAQINAPDPGVRAKAPTATALDSTLGQLTDGLDASQVTTRRECGTPEPGAASCFVKTLVRRGSHQRIHPRVKATKTFTQVFPRRRTGIAPATAAGAPAAAAPGAGTPAWLQQAYDLTYLSQTGGVGDTVGIVDAYDDPTAEADLATYRSRYGLPPCTTANGCFRKLNQNGSSTGMPVADSGWAEEISLDLDAVSALCPNCKIVLVEANSNYQNDLAAAIATAVAAGAKQVSNSYGASEPYQDPYLGRTFPGVTLLASTGDNGTMPAGYSAYPAAFPGFVAVGGTSLALSGGAPTARGFGESAWAGAGSGCNTHSGVVKPSWQTDTACPGRSYADVSAVADPNTGLIAYSSSVGGWFLVGGTSLSSPLVAAYMAVTGISDTTGKWAYDNSALLNDPVSGSNGSCSISYICNATTGYDGPTGIGSISGALVSGAPGVAAPSKSSGYAQSASAATANLAGGVYPNGRDTTYFWQYGTTTAYDSQTTPAGIGAGTAPVLTNATLTGLAASTTYHYRLVATNSAGTAYGYDYTFTTASAGSLPPANTAPPAVTGTPTQGQTLTASTGTWSPAATGYAYQWQRSTDGGTTWTPISGAAGSGYVPGAADLGALVRVQVTATNGYGPGVASSAPAGPIASGAPINTSPPVISGTPRRGQVLTAASGWNPAASITYQWQRSSDGATWTNMGANSSSYTLASADVGANVRVTVTATNAFGRQAATSDAVGPVVTDPPASTTAPVLTGTTQRTYVLTTSRGSWNGAGNAYSYQWQRSFDGAAWTTIAGASGATYTLAAADDGAWVRALVTATNPDGVSTQASNATPQFVAPYPPANTVPPSIAGIPQRTAFLTAFRGTWTGPDNVYTYQWQRDAGEGYVDIAGATGPGYTLTAADENATVRVVVTATNPDAAISEASQPTTLVQDAGPYDQTPPVLTGTARRGAALTASSGSWTGLGNTYAYQWQASADGNAWTRIAGATSSTYTLGVGDEGLQIRVLVTATNADGTASAASSATPAVAGAPPAATVRPAIAGAAVRGSTLTSTRGTWDGAGNLYAYQWQRDSGSGYTDIPGATTSSYALAVADEGAKVRLVVTASNPDTSVAAASDPTAVVVSSPPVNTAAPAISGPAQRGATLGATQGSWTGNGNAYAYQWQSSTDGTTWTNLAGATSLSYPLGVADEGRLLRVVVTATNPDAMVVAASAPTTRVPSAPPVSTAAPVVSGTAQRGGQLTATGGAWDGIGNAYAYQWQRDSGAGFADIPGATDTTYTLGVADELSRVRVVVGASNDDGAASAASNAVGPVPISAPAVTVRPAVAGTAVRGTALSSTRGTWDGLGNSYAYQWQRDSGAGFVDIAGATGTAYTLTVADEGARVRLLVTASNPDGTLSAASDPTATVAAAPPANTLRPAVSGTAQRAATLTATTGNWSGVANTLAFQWQRSADGGATWTAINGATSLSYTLGLADVGAIVRMLVTATNDDGIATATSSATATVAGQGPLNTAAPALSGTAVRAGTLTATPGSWNGAGNRYAYQWQRNPGSGFADIRGATDTSYTLTVADVGASMRVVVTATNVEGSASAASAATSAVQAAYPVNLQAPSVAGTAQRGSTLTASLGTWSGPDNAYAYQWQRDAGSGFANVAGATAPTYVLGVGDEGARLRVMVTAANPDASINAYSAATAAVAWAPPVNTAYPAISGTLRRTATLIASPGAWTGVGNTYAYQWQRTTDLATWTDIAGATDTSYTLAAGDVGARLRVVVTASNPDRVVSVPSAFSAVVQAAPPVSTGAPAVAGSATLGSRLSATTGDWSPVGTGYAYQWQRNAGSGFAAIAGATDSSYTLVRADVGATVRVRVTATNADGSGTATSAATDAVTAPPLNLVAPAAPAGTLVQGATLTADRGSWDSAAGYDYTWLRCPGAATTADTSCAEAGSGAAYTLGGADVGHTLAVRVTASSAGGSTAATSALTGVVQALTLTNRQAPSIGGTPQIPRTLTASPGVWNLPLDDVAYTWKRCAADGASNCQAVGASDHYALSDPDDGHAIVLSVAVTAAGQSATAQSAALLVTEAPVPQAAVVPTVAGTAARGRTLTASPGSWTNNPTRFAYQWRRCDAGGCADIDGATASAYTLTRDDEGAALLAVVTAENAAGTGTASSARTAAVAAVPPVNTARPVIQGAAAQGATLTVTSYAWQSTADTVYAISWQRCDATGCGAIAGASGVQYTPTAADVGYALVAVSTASNPDGTVSARSDRSATIAPAAPRWAALPVLSTSAGHVGDVLGITPGVWTGPAVTTDTIQMMRCTNVCTPRGDANVASYTVASADLGAILRVRETASNAGGDTVVWSARYVGPVLNAQAASSVLRHGTVKLRNSKGVTLAVAARPRAAAAAAAAKRGVVKLRRAGHVSGRLSAWACPAALGSGPAPPPCSRKVSLRRTATLRLPASATGALRVVVVKQRRG